jgi:hypothetical protein
MFSPVLATLVLLRYMKSQELPRAKMNDDNIKEASSFGSLSVVLFSISVVN